ncbi:hypothetical protein MMC26_006227 [Xylographa opegraphella]|nr:hypothetical protein [Xylographa opegraphella]
MAPFRIQQPYPISENKLADDSYSESDFCINSDILDADLRELRIELEKLELADAI